MKNMLIAILVCLAAWGYSINVQAEKLDMTPEQAAEARRIIVNWLECEECTEGQREAVLKLGKIAVPSLVACLREGPSPASLELQRRHLITTYRNLKKYRETHPGMTIRMSEKEYVKTYMDNYIALYQVRAAEALSDIGGPDAKRAVEEASMMPLRDDVRTAVKTSLEKLKK